MPSRLTDRYDVEGIRFTRKEPNDPMNRDLLNVVDGIRPGGSVYHVLRDIPDDSGDEMTILVDGVTVIHFELARISFKKTRLVGGPPCDIQIETVDDYRRRGGQGKHRIFLDHAVADARRLLAKDVRFPD